MGYIHKAKPRYYRDQLGVIKQLFEEWNKGDVLKGLMFTKPKVQAKAERNALSSFIYKEKSSIHNSSPL